MVAAAQHNGSHFIPQLFQPSRFLGEKVSSDRTSIEIGEMFVYDFSKVVSTRHMPIIKAITRLMVASTGDDI
jgi:hypothetical protein